MRTSKGVILTALVAVLSLSAGALVVASGDDQPAAPALAKAEAPKAIPPAKVESKEGAVTGVVKIKGEIGRIKKIKMDADAKCAALHADPIPSEEIVADKDQNVRWAFVYVKKGAEGKKPASMPPPAVIDQKGCHYEPHVLGLVAGQELIIRNSDDLLHNIHALPFNNKEFNEGQPQKGMEAKKSFTTPEIMVKVKCDIHAWMGAWIGVLDHPYFSVTDASGKFEIKGLPDGKYTLECWHERYKSVPADIDVKGGNAMVNFELTDKKE